MKEVIQIKKKIEILSSDFRPELWQDLKEVGFNDDDTLLLVVESD